MVHERASGGAGLRPAGPQRATAPAAEPAPDLAPEPERDLAAESRATPTPEPPAQTGAIPVEEAPLDPRAIARASLAAGRNASLWWVSTGITVAVVVSLAVGTRAGSVVLAAVVAACGVVRWVAAAPGPVALSVRARWIDVSVLFALALGIAGLASILPDGWV